jgi:hypothetical protein
MAEKPWCEGGPPRSLLDAVRSVMQPEGGMQRSREMTPREVGVEIHERFPRMFPHISTIDVANEMKGFYG